MNKNFRKYVHSLIAIPMLAFSLPTATLPGGMTMNVASQSNIGTAVVEEIKTPDTTEYRAALIDGYFAAKKLPMAGYGKVLVEAADKYDIDWRLLPALAMRESTGGKFACGGKLEREFNPYGWNSCKGSGFPTMEESADTMAKHLSGNHPRTAAYYKKSQGNVKAILQTYNPPSVVPTYAQEVMKIMGKISMAEEVTLPSSIAEAPSENAVALAK